MAARLTLTINHVQITRCLLSPTPSPNRAHESPMWLQKIPKNEVPLRYFYANLETCLDTDNRTIHNQEHTVNKETKYFN